MDLQPPCCLFRMQNLPKHHPEQCQRLIGLGYLRRLHHQSHQTDQQTVQTHPKSSAEINNGLDVHRNHLSTGDEWDRKDQLSLTLLPPATLRHHRRCHRRLMIPYSVRRTTFAVQDTGRTDE